MNFMKLIRPVLFSIALLFILLTSLFIFLFTTTPGLYALVKLSHLHLPGKLSIQDAKGNLAHELLLKKLIYEDQSIRYVFYDVKLNWKPLYFIFSKTLEVNDLQAKTLAVTIKKNPQAISHNQEIEYAPPNLSFPLTMKKLWIKKVIIKQENIQKAFQKVRLSTSYNLIQWKISYLKFNHLNLDFNLNGDIQSHKPYSTKAELLISNLPQHPLNLQGRILLQGDMEHLNILGNIKGPVQAQLKGTLLQGTSVDLTLQWDKLLKSSPYLNITRGNIRIFGNFKDLKITGNAFLKKPASTLSFEGEWDGQQLTGQADLQGNRISIASNFLYNSNHASLKLYLNPGFYEIKNTQSAKLSFQEGKFEFNLTPQALNGSVKITLDPEKILQGKVTLPHAKTGNFFSSTQKIKGTLTANIQSLEFLRKLSPDISAIQGKIKAKLSLDGTLKKPNLQGVILLTDGGIVLPKFDMDIHPIQLTVQSKNNQWQAQGSISSENHVLALKGQGLYYPKLQGDILVDGSDISLIKSAELSVAITPHLNLHFNPDLLTITGTILIPKGDCKPISFSSSTGLTEDALFVEKNKHSSSPFNIAADVEISMGQDVLLNIKGLEGYLDGSIHVKKAPKSDFFAIGELTIRDGKYKAYGQKLNIEQGQLLFTGGALDNPAVRIRAVRTFTNSNTTFTGSNQLFDFNPENLQTFDFGDKTTVGIEISGRLKTTKIKLFSIPTNISQADILSMLILGTPANQANKSGGQLLLTAISSMNLDSGSKGLQLLEQLKQSLGFDFNVENTSQYNQRTNQMTEGTAFVVGKALTSRIYLSYNIGLFQEDVNVLTLKYLLNKFFSVQVTTSDSGSGVDLIYTRSKG